MHRQNRLDPQQDLSHLSTAGGYIYSSKQKWTGVCFPVPRAGLLLAQLNSLPCTLAKHGCFVSAASWESPGPVLFPSAGAGSGHSWPGNGQPRVNTRRKPHRQCWGPGLLEQEQPLIPESLVTADREKKAPKQNALTGGPSVTCI